MRASRAKEKLLSGECIIGSWIHAVGSPVVVELIARAGFDFVYIDMEHSSFSLETVGGLCKTAMYLDLVPIVRPSAKLPHLISRTLDAGAMGLLVPHVDTAEEAREVVKWAKYPPVGERGLTLSGPHTGYQKADGGTYPAFMNQNSLIIVQVESLEGVKHLDEILSVEGIDGAVIGRSDLSQDLGLPGQVNHPRVTECVDQLIAACARHHVASGLLVNRLEDAEACVKKGVQIIPFGNEVNLLGAVYHETAGALREFIPSKGGDGPIHVGP